MGTEFEAPSGWRYASLGELEDEGVIAEIQDGNHGERHPKASDYIASGVPFIMAKDLEGGRLNLNDCSFISEQVATSLRVGFAKPGDVLLTHKATMGRVTIVPNDFDYVMLTPQVTYYRIGDTQHLSNLYLKYAFLGPDFQHQLNSDSDQSTRRYIGVTAQRRLQIPLPPPSEQWAISHILGTLDDKIELNRRMSETLEAMARAIFQSWFVDFDPIHAKTEGRDPGLPKPIADVFPDRLDDSDLGVIPAGWEIGSLLRLGRLLSGGTPKTDRSDYWNGDVAWASAKDVSQCGQVFLVETERAITNSGLEESATQLMPAFSSVVVARGATTGRLVMLGREMAMNQTCYALTTLTDTPFTLFCLLNHEIDGLVHAAHGSVFDTITTATFELSQIVLPNRPGLVAFETVVSPLFLRILANTKESLGLAALRDALLPKLISGEIRVKDAERIAAGVT